MSDFVHAMKIVMLLYGILAGGVVIIVGIRWLTWSEEERRNCGRDHDDPLDSDDGGLT